MGLLTCSVYSKGDSALKIKKLINFIPVYEITDLNKKAGC
jgi:hypothetical protein